MRESKHTSGEEDTFDDTTSTESVPPLFTCEPLAQGPSTKNQALRDVEYIFQCLLGVEHISVEQYGEHYAPRNDSTGSPFNFQLNNINSGSITALCPNGQTYNLSLALKHANLNYFMLQDDTHSQDIIKQCLIKLGAAPDAAIAKPADRLYSDIGRALDEPTTTGLPIYASEQAAIKLYSSKQYKKMNALLRAQPYGFTTTSLEKTFIECMLAISGVNKNIRFGAVTATDRSVLTRYEGKLPITMHERMKIPGQTVLRPGFISFSEKNPSGAFHGYPSAIVINNAKQQQSTIEPIAVHKGELEITFVQPSIQITSYQIDQRIKKAVFNAVIVNGVATEYDNQYFIQLALTDAFELLKQPYKEMPDPLFGVPRHVHGPAHHVRASILVSPVINYLKRHGASKALREFCANLAPLEIQIMQVMMMFSRTGREGEAGPSELETFLRYNYASADNLATFLRERMAVDEADIELYKEVLINAGNPRYHELVTGANEQEKNRKLFLSYIAALAHKLDLPRVYTKPEYNTALAAYSGTAPASSKIEVVTPSANQYNAFKHLESFSMSLLIITGDAIMFPNNAIESKSHSRETFIKNNSDILFCWQQCQLNHIRFLKIHSPNSVKHLALNKAIRVNNVDTITYSLPQFTSNEFMHFEELFNRTVISTLTTSKHDYCGLLKAALQVMPTHQLALHREYDIAVNHERADIAEVLIDYLDRDQQIEKLVHTLTTRFYAGVFDKLLAKIGDLSHVRLTKDSIMYLALKSRRSLTDIQKLIANNAHVRKHDILCAFDFGAHKHTIITLASHLPTNQLDINLVLRLLKEPNSTEIRTTLAAQLGTEADTISLLFTHYSKTILHNPAIVALCLTNLPSESDLIIDELVKRRFDFVGADPRQAKLLLNAANETSVKHLLLNEMHISRVDNKTILDYLASLPLGLQQTETHYILSRQAYEPEKNENLLYCALQTEHCWPLVMAMTNPDESIDYVHINKDLLLCAAHSKQPKIIIDQFAKYTPVELLNNPDIILKIIANMGIDHSIDWLDAFIANGYGINTLDDRGESVLSVGLATHGDALDIQQLITRNAQVTEVTLNYLAMTCRYISAEVQQIILDNTPAKHFSDTPRLTLQLLEGVDATQKHPLLHKAISAGFDVNSHNEDGTTALCSAILNEAPSEYIEAMLNSGAIATQDDYKQYIQSRENADEIACLLIQQIPVDSINADDFMKMLAATPTKDQLLVFNTLHANNFNPTEHQHLTGAYKSIIECSLKKYFSVDVIVTMISMGCTVKGYDLCLAISLGYDDTLKTALFDRLEKKQLTNNIIIHIIKDTTDETITDTLDALLAKGVIFNTDNPSTESLATLAIDMQLPVATFQALLRKGINVTTKDLLHAYQAMSEKHCDMDTLQLLLNETPLEAIQTIIVDIIKFDIYTQQFAYWLHHDFIEPNETLRQLLSNFPSIPTTSDIPYQKVIARQQQNIVDALALILHKQPTYLSTGTVDADGKTVLMIAIIGGLKPVVDLLFQKGVDVNVCDSEGNSALTYAINHNDIETACKLLEVIDPALLTKPNNSDESPLILAMKNRHIGNLGARIAERCDVSYLSSQHIKMIRHTALDPTETQLLLDRYYQHVDSSSVTRAARYRLIYSKPEIRQQERDGDSLSAHSTLQAN
ncbi:MAG: SidE phosphodiesterase domain-containing protein [Coxiellaceae bacterium]|nr:SidE phosphodiesterase domain-containing protein [Coxiellaceae bacterium]